MVNQPTSFYMKNSCQNTAIGAQFEGNSFPNNLLFLTIGILNEKEGFKTFCVKKIIRRTQNVLKCSRKLFSNIFKNVLRQENYFLVYFKTFFIRQIIRRSENVFECSGKLFFHTKQVLLPQYNQFAK